MRNWEDLECVKESANRIEGWLSDSEGEFLYKSARGVSGRGVIVEIGSWKGKSTVWLAKGAKAGSNTKIYAIDPHTGGSEHRKHGDVWTFDQLRENLEMAGVDEIVVPVVKTSEEAAKGWDKPVEFIFIDGAHEYELVKLDFQLWFPHVIEGGRVAFHDTITIYWSGPAKVAKQYIYRSRYFKNLGIIDGITFGTKVTQNSVGDRLRNRYMLALRDLMELGSRLPLLKPVRALAKKALAKIQFPTLFLSK